MKRERTDAELEALKAKMDKLAPHERLRLAAELLAEEQVQTTLLAHAVAERVVSELGLAIRLAELGGHIRILESGARG